MKLLLVDDEEYVIESIKKNVNLKAVGVEQVYTAFSMKQAQDIMELVPVDIIISDIVMPRGTGFDFIHWVREKEFQVQVIFLTSYAEFDYAKRAIFLESVDYLLKPIDYEKLKEALKRAAEKAGEVRKLQDYTRVNQHWVKNRPVLQKDFWREALKGNIPETDFCSEALRRYLPYEKEEDFLMLYLSFSEKKRELWDEKTLGFVVGNVLAEMLEKTSFQMEAVIPEDKSCFAVILTRKKQNIRTDEQTEKEIFEEFVRWLSERIRIDIWCGVGCWGKACRMQEALGLIKAMQEGSLSFRNKVLYLSDFECPENTYHNPNLNVWETLLEEEKEEEILTHIRQYLEDMENKEMITREILKSFQMDISQLVYTWLAKQGIKAHALFSSKEDEACYHNALRGLYGAREYGENLISKAIQYRKYVNRTESITEQIRQYIDVHYREEIRRDELGELVFLNTDYMSRIFKREAGISISAYILQKRVEEAKKLLTRSDLPINTVSIYVGYSNFSYFTKMFKDNTGYAPLEYRRKYSDTTKKKEGNQK